MLSSTRKHKFKAGGYICTFYSFLGKDLADSKTPVGECIATLFDDKKANQCEGRTPFSNKHRFHGCTCAGVVVRIHYLHRLCDVVQGPENVF